MFHVSPRDRDGDWDMQVRLYDMERDPSYPFLLCLPMLAWDVPVLLIPTMSRVVGMTFCC